MRRRAKRDLMTLAGVVVVITAIIAVNVYLNLEKGKELYRSVRVKKEGDLRQQGFQIMNWEDFRSTKGSWSRGVTFSNGLSDLEGKLVNLVGFMSPIDQFTNVKDFMLLPVPITCYFCDSPPMRDIVEVELSYPTPDLVNEPVVIAGKLQLHHEKGPLFFYSIVESLWNEAVKNELDYSQKKISAEHKYHMRMGFQDLRNGDKPEKALDAGFEPPSGATTGSENDSMPKMERSIGGHAPTVNMGDLLPAEPAPATESAPAPVPEPAPAPAPAPVPAPAPAQ